MDDGKKYVQLKIREPLKHPLFFNQDTKEFPIQISMERALNIPFYYDILYANEIDQLDLPWRNPKKYIPILIEKWKEIALEIQKHFKNRDRFNAMAPMLEGLALLLDTLFWGNGKPVEEIIKWEVVVKTLPIQPINTIERLSYIFKTPNHYHSFIQLKQLFDEFYKKFRISQILSK